MIPISYNLRSLLVRKTTTLAAALGIALVVLVLASALMLAEGVQRTLLGSGRADTVIVLRKGSDAELTSTIEDTKVALLLTGPHLAKDAQGHAAAVGEVAVVLGLPKLGTDGISNVQLRGVSEASFRLRPNLRIVSGRMPRLGTTEVIIGQRVLGRFPGFALGGRFFLRKNRPVEIVGVFADGGSSYESEAWIDRDVLRSAFGRQGTVSSVRLRLDGPEHVDGFKAFVARDRRLGLDVKSEPSYYEGLSQGTVIFVTVLGVLVVLILSIGAMIGAMITMYTSVAERTREIGTLRALGFSAKSILFSFLLESILLTLCGGALGLLAAFGMGFVHFSIINFQSWTEIVFSFNPTPGILIVSVAIAVLMGLFGGFFPAMRAALVVPVSAIRD